MPEIAKSTRFFAPGVTRFLFLPNIASATLVPDAAELTAAIDLTREVDDIAGWTKSAASIETKDASTRVRPQLAGAVTLEASSITFNGSKTGEDVRDSLTEGQEGYLLIADAGLGAGKKADVYPVEVATLAKLRSLDNAPFKIRADFSITSVPAEDVTLVAAA